MFRGARFCVLLMLGGLISGAEIKAQPAPPLPETATQPETATPAERATEGTQAPAPSTGSGSTVSNPMFGVQASVLTTPVEKLVEQVRPSVVVVRFRGRNGNEAGAGSGFVVSSDGLIATNRHVLGDGRPIEVEFPDGKVYPVTAVHASDRDLDLAVVRIDAGQLPALPLGDSEKLQQGQPVIAMGNPTGLANSVVAGLVAGRREIEGQSMIQLHIPIEPGNSGGPLIDLEGRVYGLLTLKSRVTAYLGYAMPVNDLKRLLERPNPVPMSRWLTLGHIDETRWNVIGGARWTQRAGRVQVRDTGDWFGGRSLCLQTEPHEGSPLEIAVAVKLEDEEGAAGIAFHSDGEHRHYGFYPTGGKLRLTRFDGPTVSSWRILHEVRSSAYRPGEWNELRVQISDDRLRCLVNGELVIEEPRLDYHDGLAGMVKFRDTVAEFRRFRAGREIDQDRPNFEQITAITDLIREMDTKRPPSSRLVGAVRDVSPLAPRTLVDEARQLEQQAERLRQLARLVHVRTAQQALVEELDQPEDKIDLLRAALLVAWLDNEEIDVDAYLKTVDSLARRIREQLQEQTSRSEQLATLNRILFNEYGFHGSRTNYYHRSNSYMNEVIDDREGLPITLSVLYMEIAGRIGLPMDGIGLPGHFHVALRRQADADDAESTASLELIDVFEGGRIVPVGRWVAEFERETGRPFDRELLKPQTKHEIIERMLRNLWNVALGQEDRESMLRYTDTILKLDESSVEQRWYRALLELQTGRIDEAIEDADWLMEHPSPNIDRLQLRQFRQHLETLK